MEPFQILSVLDHTAWPLHQAWVREDAVIVIYVLIAA